MDLLKVCLTAFISYVVLFLIARVIGHRQISQLDFFDYISGISIGSIAAEMATELEKPLLPFAAMLVYGLITVLMNTAAGKLPKLRKYISGTPTILMDDGKLYRKNLKKARIDLSEFMALCRGLGYFDLSAVQTAVFEYNGKLSILPVSGRRPLTPADLQLAPAQDYIFAEVIMDGRVLGENLQRMGYDARWLEKQLFAQGYASPADVFLGLCDRNGNVSLYACGD